MGFNVCSFVRSIATLDPSRVAVVARRDTRELVTYGALDERTRRAASALVEAGLTVGDRVALVGENGLDLVVAWLGAFAAGLVVVPLPPMSTASEIASRATHAGCRAVICDATCEARVRDALPSTMRFDPAALATEGRELAHALDLPADALAMLLYTSGTTGAPRGVMITHVSLITHTMAIVHHVLRLGPTDVVAGFLPLSHSYGVRMTLLAPFFAGATTVLAPRFDAARALALVREEGVTWWPVVPTMASALARLEDARVDSLRFVTSAGAPLAPEVRERAERALGCPVRDAYGMTEATFTAIDVPSDGDGAGTVGRPVPGVEVIVLSAEGDILPPGELGEIAVRGQNVTAGYFEDSVATRAARVRDGFFRSGDLGRFDEAGRLVVVDRIKDLIVRGGFNVVPAEVEAVLARHDGVLGVVVVGVPDVHLGEEIVAVIQSEHALSSAQLDAFARATLSPIKVPRRYAFVRELPLGSSGKVLRRVLRDALVSGSIASDSVTV